MKNTVSVSLVGHKLQSELATGMCEKEQVKQHSRAIALAESVLEPDTYWHSRRVADKVDGIVTATVAWLHDVVEDTDVDLDRLKRMGFADDIREASADPSINAMAVRGAGDDFCKGRDPAGAQRESRLRHWRCGKH